MWRDRRILDLFGIEHPIVQAPMAGPVLVGHGDRGRQCRRARVAAIRHAQPRAGARRDGKVRTGTSAPVNMNFFCHMPPA